MRGGWWNNLGLTLVPAIVSIRHEAAQNRLLLSEEKGGEIALAPVTPAMATLLGRLQGVGLTYGEALGQAAQQGGDGERMFLAAIQALARHQIIRWTFGPAAAPVAWVDSFSAWYFLAPFDMAEVEVHRPLSRHCYLRQEDGQSILRHTVLHARMVVQQAGAPLLASVLAGAEGEEAGPVAEFRRFLFYAGFLEPREPYRGAVEDWEFQDLLFHDLTRMFGSVATFGKGDRLAGARPLPPKRKPPMPGIPVTLPDPAGQPSQPLEKVMEARRSSREPGLRPLTLADLSCFLWRAARQCAPPDSARLPGWRPMPSGGAMWELEFYLAVGRCDGLDPGFYHYDGLSHRLVRLEDRPAPREELLQFTRMATRAESGAPDCLVVIASRMPRAGREYQGIAYRLSLLHLGIALQNFYLVATDLGLGGCAIGSGRSDLFATLSGLDPLEECALGEFVLNGEREPV